MLNMKGCLIQDLYDRFGIVTERMISCIKYNGIDYRDVRGVRLLFRVMDMTDEQMDIFFSYNPNLFFDMLMYHKARSCPYLPTHYLLNRDKALLVIRRFLDHDKDNRYIYDFKHTIENHFNNLIDNLALTNSNDKLKYRSTLFRMKQLFENKEKKVLSFFELMIKRIKI